MIHQLGEKLAALSDPETAATIRGLLSVVEDQRRASVVVQDTGIGIPADAINRRGPGGRFMRRRHAVLSVSSRVSHASTPARGGDA
mgnify:CR=1 FL=1